MTELHDEERRSVERRRVPIQATIDPEVWAAMRALAERNRRPYSTEIEIAFEEHLELDRRQRQGDNATGI